MLHCSRYSKKRVIRKWSLLGMPEDEGSTFLLDVDMYMPTQTVSCRIRLICVTTDVPKWSLSSVARAKYSMKFCHSGFSKSLYNSC